MISVREAFSDPAYDLVPTPWQEIRYYMEIKKWRERAFRRSDPFKLILAPGRWRVRRLFYCVTCQQSAAITGRQKRICPFCHFQMWRISKYVVPERCRMKGFHHD